jgi:hypothetical protein
LNKSKAKMVYTNVYTIPPELGQFDVAVIGQILVHLSDPVRALSSVIDRIRGQIVVTEGMVDSDEPVMSLCGRAATDVSDQSGIAWSWWHLSTGLYRENLRWLDLRSRTSPMVNSAASIRQSKFPVRAAANHYCGAESD